MTTTATRTGVTAGCTTAGRRTIRTTRSCTHRGIRGTGRRTATGRRRTTRALQQLSAQQQRQREQREHQQQQQLHEQVRQEPEPRFGLPGEVAGCPPERGRNIGAEGQHVVRRRPTTRQCRGDDRSGGCAATGWPAATERAICRRFAPVHFANGRATEFRTIRRRAASKRRCVRLAAACGSRSGLSAGVRQAARCNGVLHATRRRNQRWRQHAGQPRPRREPTG